MKFYGGGVGHPQKYGEWEVIEPPGEGGQSTVYLVRNPARAGERELCIQKLMQLSGQGCDKKLDSVDTIKRPSYQGVRGAAREIHCFRNVQMRE